MAYTSRFSLPFLLLFTASGPLSDPLNSFGASPMNRAECDVEEIYDSEDAQRGTAAVSERGDFVEVETFLFPATMSSGAYEVTLTREDSDLYRSAEGVWIKTRYCYEYAHRQRAVLRVTGSGYTKGEVIFLKGALRLR